MKFTGVFTLLGFAFLASQVSSAAINNDAIKNFDQKLDFSTVLKMYYSAIKQMLPCGYPALNIPVLAPYTLDNYDFNYTTEYYSTVGSLSNIMVTGLNDFYFLGNTFNVTTNRTTFDVIFPDLKFVGAVVSDNMVNIAGYPIKWSSSGPMETKLIDFRFIGEFVLSPLEDDANGSQITDFKMKFYLGDVVINNYNNLVDIAANNFYNKSAREVILLWAKEIQDVAQTFYAKYLISPVNDLLKNVSVNDVLDFLVQETMLLNKVNCNE